MEKTKEVAVLEKEANSSVVNANNLSVTNDSEFLRAGEFLSNVKKYAKSAKEEKEKATKPLNETLKTVRSWFAPIEDSCEKAIQIISSKMMKYQDEVEAKKRKAEREAQAKIDEARAKEEAGKITEKQAEKVVAKQEQKIEEAPVVITKSNSFHTRVDRKVRFTTIGSLNDKDIMKLVAGGYIVWDEIKGRRDALSGALTIGVEVYEQKSLI